MKARKKKELYQQVFYSLWIFNHSLIFNSFPIFFTLIRCSDDFWNYYNLFNYVIFLNTLVCNSSGWWVLFNNLICFKQIIFVLSLLAPEIRSYLSKTVPNVGEISTPSFFIGRVYCSRWNRMTRSANNWTMRDQKL